MKKGRIISILALKGGVGKTETVLNLAYGLAQKNKKILVCDLDPQSNLTSVLMKIDKDLTSQDAQDFRNYFDKQNKRTLESAFTSLEWFVNKFHFEHSINDVIKKECDIKAAITSTQYTNIDILPASEDLTEADGDLKSQKELFKGDPISRLRSALVTVENEYDYILIDNQPFENALTYNALTACHKPNDLVIVPTKINRGGIEGLYATMKKAIEIERVQGLEFDMKILITMVNRNKIDASWIENLHYAFNDLMFKSSIRYQAKPVEEASMRKRILLDVNSTSKVAMDYQHLVDEIYDMT